MSQRKFTGIGEMERAGYIPAGSATERESRDPEAAQFLEFYGEHKGDCPGRNPNQGCSCGLREAIATLRHKA